MPVSRYVRELLAALGLYALILVGSILLLQHVALPRAWQAVVALLPMVACVFVVAAVLRELRRLDELQRRIQFEAMAFAFAGVALLTLSYGFLEGLGWPRLSMFSVWPLMAGLWVVGLAIARRRYA